MNRRRQPQLPVCQVTKRRSVLKSVATCVAAMLTSPANAVTQIAPKVTGMGLVLYDCSIRRNQMLEKNPQFDLFEPLTFLKHCRELGAGGMQASLGVPDADAVRELRDYAEQHSLFIDAIVSPPRDAADIDRFDAEIRSAAEVGALAVRTVIMPGRRYERFDSLAEFREFAARGQRMLELAAPVVEKHRVPLAVENHKDQRNDERVSLFEHIDSEFVGACVDTGNSFALCEDPIETIKVLAPWAKTVHLKDQAVREYDDGFLFGDIPLGQGCFDVKQMVRILRNAQPGIRFTLELITRDALKVSCLTKKYWLTMPGVPAGVLARTMRYVRAHHSESLQHVSSLTPTEQLALEDANVAASLTYAGEVLGL